MGRKIEAARGVLEVRPPFAAELVDAVAPRVIGGAGAEAVVEIPRRVGDRRPRPGAAAGVPGLPDAGGCAAEVTRRKTREAGRSRRIALAGRPREAVQHPELVGGCPPDDVVVVALAGVMGRVGVDGVVGDQHRPEVRGQVVLEEIGAVVLPSVTGEEVDRGAIGGELVLPTPARRPVGPVPRLMLVPGRPAPDPREGSRGVAAHPGKRRRIDHQRCRRSEQHCGERGT